MDLLSEVLAAEARVRPFVRETPVEESPALGRIGNARDFLKMEHLIGTIARAVPAELREHEIVDFKSTKSKALEASWSQVDES